MIKESEILLVGNGTYSNRGCEAIVRGTMEILRQVFTEGLQVTLATFGPADRVARQAREETDAAITHVALGKAQLRRGSWDWLVRCAYVLAHAHQDRRYLTAPRNFPMLAGPAADADIALEIGGDNYSLDYGWPAPYLALDRYLLRRGVPVALWGASVGPFNAAPPVAQQEMFRHLAALPAIMARESMTAEYLQQHGNLPVCRVCDPAFLMPARMPAHGDFPSGGIGLNFSPLLAKYAAGGDSARFVMMCVDIITRLLTDSRHSIVLIPHVTSDAGGEDDATLNQRIYQKLGNLQARVYCIPGTLTAAEYKWVIAQCTVFAGARTHATIAAISSGVPTISFAYSTKALGINRDVFGSLAYCVTPAAWERPDELALRILAVLEESGKVRSRLKIILPEIFKRALSAGFILRDMLQESGKLPRQPAPI